VAFRSRDRNAVLAGFRLTLDWDPRKEIQTYRDLDRFGFFQDEWLRGGPVRRWVPKAYANSPIYTFETADRRDSQVAHQYQ
jgi:hypothetical protein